MTKKKKLKSAVPPKFGDGGINPPVNPPTTPPTTQDSLTLYNNAIAKAKFYKGNPDYTMNHYRDGMVNSLNNDLQSLIESLEQPNNFNSIAQNYYNHSKSNGKLLMGSPDPRFKKISKDIGSFGDILYGVPNTWFNTLAPPIYLHRNIKPNSWVYAGSDKFGDMSGIPIYNPVSIYPQSLGPVPKEAYEYNDIINKPYIPNLDTDVSAFMKSQGMDFSYANRKKLASEYGIKDYKGSAEQNLELLELIKKGEPGKNTPVDNAQKAIEMRSTSRKNPDGTESTHLMAYSEAGGKYYAYPTLFPDGEGGWIEKSDSDDFAAFKEAQKRGETMVFDTEEEAAKFAEGSWKPNTPEYQKPKESKNTLREDILNQLPKEGLILIRTGNSTHTEEKHVTRKQLESYKDLSRVEFLDYPNINNMNKNKIPKMEPGGLVPVGGINPNTNPQDNSKKISSYSPQEIKNIQKELYAKGYLKKESDIDGIWGPNTQKAFDASKNPSSFETVDSAKADLIRNIIPAPMNISQAIAKNVFGDARISNESLDDRQKVILYQTIKNAQERTGNTTRGGTSYADYGQQGFGSSEQFNQWFNRGDISVAEGIINSITNPGFTMASTVGRGIYNVDPKDPNKIQYTDVYDWNSNENNFKGKNVYQNVRNYVRDTEKVSTEEDPDKKFRMNVELDVEDIESKIEDSKVERTAENMRKRTPNLFSPTTKMDPGGLVSEFPGGESYQTIDLKNQKSSFTPEKPLIDPGFKIDPMMELGEYPQTAAPQEQTSFGFMVGYGHPLMNSYNGLNILSGIKENIYQKQQQNKFQSPQVNSLTRSQRYGNLGNNMLLSKYGGMINMAMGGAFDFTELIPKEKNSMGPAPGFNNPSQIRRDNTTTINRPTMDDIIKEESHPKLSTGTLYNPHNIDVDKYINRPVFTEKNITKNDIVFIQDSIYQNTGKRVTPEFIIAQAQAEGAFTKDGGRSKATNPFNVGEYDTHTGMTFESKKQGLKAYAELLSKKYLVGDKTEDDLLSNYVNHLGQRYATAPDYEEVMKQQMQYIRSKYKSNNKLGGPVSQEKELTKEQIDYYRSIGYDVVIM